jgi:hypothetical protein
LMIKTCENTPSLSIAPTYTVNESAGKVTLTVTLSSPSTSVVSVAYATANGSALAGSDYTLANGTLQFPAGSTSQTIDVPILDDSILEGSESFVVNLSNPNGATISVGQSTVNIIDNEQNANDDDGDGVLNNKDLCPGTALGTTVNEYGCQTALPTCDYTTTSISFGLATQAPAGKVTKYVLADALDGRIVQISNTPSFTNLTQDKTYMVLAYSYENDNSVTNLIVNNYIKQVFASCSDWSTALVVRVCPNFVGGSNCDYTTSSITLRSGAAPSGATTKYILVNSSGLIVNMSDTPTFSGLSGTSVYNAYAVSYTGTISNLAIGNNYSSITGACYDLSLPLSIKVCVCKPNICLPVTALKVK